MRLVIVNPYNKLIGLPKKKFRSLPTLGNAVAINPLFSPPLAIAPTNRTYLELVPVVWPC